MKTRCLAVPAAVLAVTLSSGVASAQTLTGFAVDRFDPSERGSDWFALESLDLRGNGRPALGVVGDFAYRPLALYNRDGTVNASIVRDQYFLHPGASLVLLDTLRLSVSVPIAVYQFGHLATANGQTYAPPSGANIGDVRLGVDFRLLGQYGDPFTMAVGAQLYLPTGSRSDYTGDEALRVQPRLMAAGELGAFVYAAKLGVEYRAFEDTFAGSQLGSELLFGASAGVKTARGHVILGPELYGSTVVSSTDGAFKTRNTPFELIFGGHFLPSDDFRIGAGVGPGLSRGYGAPAVRILASLEWAPAYAPPPPPDRDHDGIVDSEDACPDKPGVRTNDPKTNGCPVPPDRDRDGVPDADDACPDVPGVKTDDPKTNGCPPPPPDRDHDGILDIDDACPDVPGIKTDDAKTNGCPPDRDHDGIADGDDACPDVPGVATNDPKTNGCPSDRDKDGIPDTADACPDEAGPADPDPKKNGCPKAIMRNGEIKILEQIKFRFGKADLDPASDPILEAVQKVMVDHPEIKKIRIEGHTDNVGRAAYNLSLSNGRAASVMKWLVEHGVEASRLESQGFGMTRPIGDNKTEEGKKNNRRVEFHILEGPKGPTEETAPTPAPPPQSPPPVLNQR